MPISGTDLDSSSIENLTVAKRDGQVVAFDPVRVQTAVQRCLVLDCAYDEQDADHISTLIQQQVTNLVKLEQQPVGVETVQNLVESQLMAGGYYPVAKQYILFREAKRLQREEQPIPEAVIEAFKANDQYFSNEIQKFQALDKFARFDHELGRRETWPETVNRVCEFFKVHCTGQNFTITDHEWAYLKDGLLNLEASPSMRCVQMAGPALNRCHVGVYNCSFQFLQSTTDLAEELYVLMQGTGVGFSVEAEFAVEKFPRVKRQKKTAEATTYVIPDTTEGWCDAYKAGLDAWWSGEDLRFDYSQIREAGTPLKTKGGKSSGPGPLKDLLEFARKRILARQGRYLSSLDLHDINCFAHRIVRMGGVRRASGISLSDLHDHEMRDCKQGEFWNTNSQRNQANNSAVYNEKPDPLVWMEEWLTLAKSGSGERGIFNRGGLKNQFPKRRKHQGHLFGTNPCVTADTWVPTDEGPRQVSQLLNDSFVTFVDGAARQATNFFQTGVKPVFQVKLANGMQLKLTEDHQVLAVTHQSRKTQRTAWKPISELNPGDCVILHNHRELATWVGKGTRNQGWLLGNLLGDGCFGTKDQALLDYWGDDCQELAPQVLALVHETVGARVDCQGASQTAAVGKVRIQSSKLGELATEYGLGRDKKIKPAVEQTSAEFHAGFLSGWFDADGSVQGDQTKGVSVRLASSTHANLEAAQRMLHRLGINSTIYTERRAAGYRELPDGQGGTGTYWCETQHELVVANDNLLRFQQQVGFQTEAKSKKLSATLVGYRRKLNRERFAEAIVTIKAVGTEPVYDCQVPGPHAFDANGLYVHNCGEIILRHKQFCNLSIAVIRPEDIYEDIERKTIIATIWGTLQSTMTKFNYIGEDWKKNSEEERLLGVDLLGFLDHALFQDNVVAAVVLDRLRAKVIETNVLWAKRLGINPSAATTCVKPSGDSSVFFLTAAGFKGHHGAYYVRRVRANDTNPVAQMLQAEGVPCFKDYDGSGLVLEFPMKSPAGGQLLENQTALSQLEQWKTFKVHWTEHNPSVTVYIRQEEWLAVGKWVYDNWEIVGGLSFLPYDGGVYHLAPYEAISQEDYEKRMSTFPKINWAKLVRYEKSDMTDLHQQVACAGGACEI
jgi:ribonucleotide reductase class II